jgi:hypothetical protein
MKLDGTVRETPGPHPSFEFVDLGRRKTRCMVHDFDPIGVTPGFPSRLDNAIPDSTA